MNTQIIACSNQKGGTAKTTTCVNLGIGLAVTLKLLLKIAMAPVILALTLSIWLCAGLVYVSGFCYLLLCYIHI